MPLYTLHKREADRSRKPINRGKEKPESKPKKLIPEQATPDSLTG